jgi:microcin C transport system ATP-binding protein
MTSLNPLHTVVQQLDEILELHSPLTVKQRRARSIEMLKKVGVREAESRLEAYPHQLSGGQRQRVMIAMALANNPDLLIADEPTTALDVTVQAQILELLRDLKGELGMALLLITHDLGIVRHMADRVCVMQGGRIVEAGVTEEVFARPKHAYTRQLLAAEPRGSPPKADPKAATVLTADNLKVWFPVKRGFLRRTVSHIKAVDGVSIEVKEGQTLGVVGESGSGKTTLGLAILRLIHSEGPIVYLGRRIDGFDAGDMRPLRKEMQIVFQDPYGSLSPRLSIRQIVEEGLTVQKKDLSFEEREERVAQALSEVGIDPAAMERYPHEFSGGQRQRVAIARALVTNTRLILLDEPVSALDVSIRAQIMNQLEELQDRLGVSYLFIGHDLATVAHISRRITVMYLGKIVELADALELCREPLHPYTQALFTAALPAHPDEKRERLTISGEVPSALSPSSGCRFHTRCPQAMPRCAAEEPLRKELSSGHSVACHLY